jgi:hypothetical protein
VRFAQRLQAIGLAWEMVEWTHQQDGVEAGGVKAGQISGIAFAYVNELDLAILCMGAGALQESW